MNKTTRNNEITEEMMKDSRLFPLFCDTTKLLFQLFVLVFITDYYSII